MERGSREERGARDVVGRASERAIRSSLLLPSLNLIVLDNVYMDASNSADQGRKAYMAYVAEGLGDMIQNWDEILQYQSKNGSLFNSPSATSALAIHRGDINALKYLDLLGNKFPCAGMLIGHCHVKNSARVLAI